MADKTGGEKRTLPVSFPRTIGPNASKYVQEVIDAGLSIDMMGRFEKAFAEAHGVKHCIAAPGCTPALHMVALAMGWKAADEVIVSPITDYGTVQGMLVQGIIPIFADTEPGSINFSPKTIAPCISERTKGILCVHKTGLINDMDGINELAKKHNVLVLEDCCQAVFGQYKGRLAGTLGDVAAFSFDSEKTMGSDVGGCLITNNDELSARARHIGQNRAGVMKPHFGRAHDEIGYAYRMPQCTAAICLAQLEIVRDQVVQRDAMARLLYKLFAQIPGITPLRIPESTTVYSCWMIGLNIDLEKIHCSTEFFAQEMEAAGIHGAGMGEYYLMPAALECLHKKVAGGIFPYSIPPASKKYEYSAASCPNAEKFLKTFIRWSTFCEKYTEADCQLAAEIVADVAEKNRAKA
jgi:perosamine synthetase